MKIIWKIFIVYFTLCTSIRLNCNYNIAANDLTINTLKKRFDTTNLIKSGRKFDDIRDTFISSWKKKGKFISDGHLAEIIVDELLYTILECNGTDIDRQLAQDCKNEIEAVNKNIFLSTLSEFSIY